MQKIVLLSGLWLLASACGRGNDVAIAPSLAAEVAGTYQTNGFLDYRCIALPPDKMPTATLLHETDATVMLTYLERYPVAKQLIISHLQLSRLPDNSIQLTEQGTVLGTVRIDRAFGTNGMERQGLVLRLQGTATNKETNFAFTGSKE